ncbi:MAG: hypothetical protein LLF94_02755 [Chlamydiales bacterium]|nr:hypothetical protein [Chlamydiales bacterium]
MDPVHSTFDFNSIYTAKSPELWQSIRNILKNAMQKQSYTVHDAHESTMDNVCNMVASSEQPITIASVGTPNSCFDAITHRLSKTHSASKTSPDQATAGTVDLLIAPHTLYDQIDELLSASEALLNHSPIEQHPFYKWFDLLSKEGHFIATLTSGPNVFSTTELLLGKHGLKIEEVNTKELPNLTLFRNAETFIRALDIFKTHFEQATGNTIDIKISLTNAHKPIETFCQEYVARFPELCKTDIEPFVRLLSVFSVGGDIVDLDITLDMSVKPKIAKARSFEPMFQTHSKVQTGSNELSIGQLDVRRQLQNLNGSVESMKKIKDADGAVQLEAFRLVLGRKNLSVVDLGGGRGETNAVMHALTAAGSTIRLLNIDPDKAVFKDYKDAHVAVGVKDVEMLPLRVNTLTSKDVTSHFKGEKVDAVYSSHCFYFLNGDLIKASLAQDLPLQEHPLWKYFEMIRDDGVMVVTMQTGTGSRQIRNGLLGDTGLTRAISPGEDATVELLKLFGNLGAFMRHFEPFQARFKAEIGKTIEVKPHLAVANVPFGDFRVEQDPETQGYILRNPHGSDSDIQWPAPTLLDFYGNWDFQKTRATLTAERLAAMDIAERKKYQLENVSAASIPDIRNLARKTQSTFLHILRAFAPQNTAMLHPNITLEISIK